MEQIRKQLVTPILLAFIIMAGGAVIRPGTPALAWLSPQTAWAIATEDELLEEERQAEAAERERQADSERQQDNVKSTIEKIYNGRTYVRPQDFDRTESRWSEYGPAYEANEEIKNGGATHTHAYGRATGKFVYKFALPRGKYLSGKISARMSSEFPYYGQQTPKDGYTDVALYVNSSFIANKRVIPDNGSGAWYSWNIPENVFQEGDNRIEFVIRPNGPYNNGLSIYEKSLVEGEQSAQITIEFSRTNN